MLYTNKDIKVKQAQLSWGILEFLGLGRRSRDERELSLPVPESFPAILEQGLYPEWTLGTTRKGLPKIKAAVPTTVGEQLYMIISSEAQHGYGDVYVRRNQSHLIETMGLGWRMIDGDEQYDMLLDIDQADIPDEGLLLLVRAGDNRSLIAITYDNAVEVHELHRSNSLFDQLAELGIEYTLSELRSAFGKNISNYWVQPSGEEV